MKLIYTAGPYRADTVFEVTQNIERARRAAAQVWRMGAMAMCPHLNTALFDGLVDDSLFLEGGLETLRRCDAVYVFDPHRTYTSIGTQTEIAEAKANNIPIFYDAEMLNRWIKWFSHEANN